MYRLLHKDVHTDRLREAFKHFHASCSNVIVPNGILGKQSKINNFADVDLQVVTILFMLLLK